MFDGDFVDPSWNGPKVNEPADWQWLVVGFGHLPSGQVYPRPVAVAAGPDVAADLMGDLDDTREEKHLAFPILRLDYRGRAV